jgi:hypothetical protein
MSLLPSAFVLVVFIVIAFNQTIQVIQFARGVHPLLGTAVFWGLVFVYSALLLIPLAMWVWLPKQLQPPARIDGAEYARFLVGMRKRLSRNKRLRGEKLATEAHIKAALQTLDGEADRIVSSAASTVFLSTAVSQSGRLDGLVVLAALSRLVWRVAHIYQQRPSVRQFVQLYANVASTAFVAGGNRRHRLGRLARNDVGIGCCGFPRCATTG